MGFTPEAVIVAPGTIVTWIVRDLGSSEDNLIIIRALDDGSDAVSPELKRSDRFAFTFARPGSYPFTFPKNPSEQGANVVMVIVSRDDRWPARIGWSRLRLLRVKGPGHAFNPAPIPLHRA